MIGSLVRWLGSWAARVVGQSFAVPREPSAEENLGAGI
jgi:hypothetical protein